MMQGTVTNAPLTSDEVRELRAWALADEAEVVNVTGLSRNPIARASAGLRVYGGSVIAIRVALRERRDRVADAR